MHLLKKSPCTRTVCEPKKGGKGQFCIQTAGGALTLLASYLPASSLPTGRQRGRGELTEHSNKCAWGGGGGVGEVDAT